MTAHGRAAVTEGTTARVSPPNAALSMGDLPMRGTRPVVPSVSRCISAPDLRPHDGHGVFDQDRWYGSPVKSHGTNCASPPDVIPSTGSPTPDPGDPGTRIHAARSQRGVDQAPGARR